MKGINQIEGKKNNKIVMENIYTQHTTESILNVEININLKFNANVIMLKLRIPFKRISLCLIPWNDIIFKEMCGSRSSLCLVKSN